MSWSEVFSRWYKPAMVLMVVYAVGVILDIVGDRINMNWSGDVASFDVLGISARGLFTLIFATMSKLIITLGTIAIAIKVLTESLTDYLMRRMDSEGMK